MTHPRSWHLGGVAAVAVALALTASACGGGSEAATPKRTTTTAAATTTTVAAPVAPLTGLADPSGASLTRPALSVKVENTDAARPQAGIDQADVLYEEVVEGNITRFVAIFNSTVPSRLRLCPRRREKVRWKPRSVSCVRPKRHLVFSTPRL